MRRRFLLSHPSALPRRALCHSGKLPADAEFLLQPHSRRFYCRFCLRQPGFRPPCKRLFRKNSSYMLQHLKFCKAVSFRSFLTSIFLVSVFLLRYRLGLMRNLYSAVLILYQRSQKKKKATPLPCEVYGTNKIIFSIISVPLCMA